LEVAVSFSSTRKFWLFGSLPFALVVVGACAPVTHSLDHPTMCKEQPQVPCLSGSVCVDDESRGCEICKCTAPPFVPFDRKGPPGAIEVKRDDVDPASSAKTATADAAPAGAASAQPAPKPVAR
jgi:hypothetical protein